MSPLPHSSTSFSQSSLSAQQRSQLVTLLQKNLFALLEKGIKAVFTGADEALFKGAEEARSNDTQRLFFDGIQSLRPMRKEIAEQFLRLHLTDFKAYFAGGLATDQSDQANPSEDLALSLLKEDEYEESLLVKTIANKVQKNNALELGVLRKRLELIADREYPKKIQSPIHPEPIANSFHRSLGKVELQMQIKTTLYVLFEQHVMSSLEAFYNAANKMLVSQQVLPNLSAEQVLAEAVAQHNPAFKAQQPNPTQSEAIAATDNRQLGAELHNRHQYSSNHYVSGASTINQMQMGISPASVTRPVLTSNLNPASNPLQASNHAALQFSNQTLQTQLSEQLQDISSLLSSFRQSDAEQLPIGGRSLEAFAPKAATESYEIDEVLSALEKLQLSSAQAPSSEPVTSESIKSALYQLLAKNNQQAQLYKIGDREVNTIDLVGMIFDFISQDSSLPTSSRTDISNLQALYQQLALRDTNFLKQIDHPAHILLDSMSQASSLFKGANEEKSVKNAINQTVSEALSTYQGDNQLFTELLQKFTELVEELKQRSVKREQRAVDAAKGRDKLLAARKQARNLINACLRRYNPPSMIQQFLIYAWSDVLVFIYLRSGPANQQWQSYAKAAEQLAWSGTLLDVDGQKQLAEVRPQLMESIHQGLNLLGCHPGNEVDRLIKDLIACQDAVQAKQQNTAEQLQVSLSATKKAIEQAEQAPKLKPEVEESDLNEAALHAANRLKRIKFGTWFEFKDPPCKLKLAWYSTTTQNYMFVDSSGQRSQIKSLAQLALDLESGEAVIVQDLPPQPIINRALSAAQRTLQRFAGTHKPL